MREPPAGRYAVMLTKTAASPTTTFLVEAFRGATRESSRAFTGNPSVGEIVRTGFTYAAGTPLTISEFEPSEVVTSACGALSTGRLFATGAVQDRYAQLRTFAQTNKNQRVAFVVVDADVSTAANEGKPTEVPATVSDVRASIDPARVHLSADATVSILTVNAATDISVGSVDGKLVLRVRRLTASPLPAGLLDPVRAILERGFDDFSSGFPFTVRQVSLRHGCLSVMGTTP